MGKDKKRSKESKSKRAREREREREREGENGERAEREREREREEERRGEERKRWPLSVRRLFFVHASPMSGDVYVYMRACISRGVGTCVWGRCIIVSAGSWLGGPVDISGLRCSCLSGSRTQR